jgi:hypothetical protein
LAVFHSALLHFFEGTVDGEEHGGIPSIWRLLRR